MAHLTVLHFMNLPSLYLWGTTYEKTALCYKYTECRIFGFCYELWNQEWIQQIEWSCRWKISTACHILQSLFVARDQGMFADPWFTSITKRKKNKDLKSVRCMKRAVEESWKDAHHFTNAYLFMTLWPQVTILSHLTKWWVTSCWRTLRLLWKGKMCKGNGHLKGRGIPL